MRNMSNSKEMEYCKENNTISRRFTNFPYKVEFTSKNHFLLLPDEIILKIFAFLHFWELRLRSMVCKRWYSLSLDVKLWKNVTLWSRELKVSSLEKILSCGVEIFKLDSTEITEEEVYNEAFFQSAKFDNLQCLSIICTEIKMEVLEELLALVPYLKVFTLQYSCDEISCNAFKYMNKMKLEELNFSDCYITYEAYLNCQIFKELRRLRLDSFFDVAGLLHICPNLELLDVVFGMNGGIFEEIVRMKSLKELNLDFDDMEGGVIAMLPSLKNYDNMDELHRLKVLNYNFHYFITLETLLLLCISLTELTLSEVNINYDIYGKILMMKHLKKLRLQEIIIISHDTVSKLNILKNYGPIVSLENLSISFKHFYNIPHEVEILIFLSPHLKCLHLNNCLSDAIYEYISKLSELETLHIYGDKYCKPVPSERISAILKGCPVLLEHNLLSFKRSENGIF